MDKATMNRLEFHLIRERIAEYAITYLGKDNVEKMQPAAEISTVRSLLEEAAEAANILSTGSSVPIPNLEGIETAMALLGKGYLLSVGDLTLFAKLLESFAQMKKYMAAKESLAPRVAGYARSFYELKEVSSELNRCVQHGRITNQASPDLEKIRKKIAIEEDRVKKKLDGLVHKYRSALMEPVVSMRGDRFTLPVKKEHRKLVPGTVLGESSSGQTVFVEPSDVGSIQQELAYLRADEAREETRIIGELTEMIEAHRHELSVNLEAIGHYDFLFAKAKYGRSIDGVAVKFNTDGVIRIHGGRHPLLGRSGVPLEFELGGRYDALVITGPNTGGKTVCLKTVGLLSLMAQSGLLIPVGSDGTFPVFDKVLADIGDGQSIEQSLSTFSSHMTNMIRILAEAGPSTLVLLDELATGTDPGEGVGLAIALLEELRRKGAQIVATTHFNEIKAFAGRTAGFENARMEFDVETLEPLYKLRIGEAGGSYAFQIAYKLGLAPSLIERSKEITAQVRGGRADEVDIPTAAEPRREARRQQKKPAAVPKDEQPGAVKKPFELGDCVWLHTLKRTGIVCELPNERGMMTVMVQKQKIKINRKRCSIYIDRKELYPDDYDMDIVFESVENRKKRKLMSRKHVEGLTIEYPEKE